jgi:hypothetical protein
VKARVASEIEKNQESFNMLVKKIRNLRVRLANQENELRKPTLEIEELLKKENEAIQINDFDEAQNIEVKLEECRKHVEKINLMIEESKKEMQKLREQELNLLKTKQKLVAEASESYKKAKQGSEMELETFQNNDINKHRNDKIKINKLKEKLDFLKNNLDVDRTVKIFYLTTYLNMFST